jgi:ethanolamine ammonia-lyase small subunit
MDRREVVARDAWKSLRSLTTARIALDRTGGSLTTEQWLDFATAHAAARDAVWSACDWGRLQSAIAQLGAATLDVHSQCGDRGRRLAPGSREVLARQHAADGPCDLAVIVADGLSAQAVDRQAAPVLAALLPLLQGDGWRIAPVVLARQARVALQDEVGELLQAELALTLIGERPGLDAPDSLGAYLVHAPQKGKQNADRNCVSNIRPTGLSPVAAAATLHYLLTEARRQRLSGVALKDLRGMPPLPSDAQSAGPDAALGSALDDAREQGRGDGGESR